MFSGVHRNTSTPQESAVCGWLLITFPHLVSPDGWWSEGQEARYGGATGGCRCLPYKMMFLRVSEPHFSRPCVCVFCSSAPMLLPATPFVSYLITFSSCMTVWVSVCRSVCMLFVCMSVSLVVSVYLPVLIVFIPNPRPFRQCRLS